MSKKISIVFLCQVCIVSLKIVKSDKHTCIIIYLYIFCIIWSVKKINFEARVKKVLSRWWHDKESTVPFRRFFLEAVETGFNEDIYYSLSKVTISVTFLFIFVMNTYNCDNNWNKLQQKFYTVCPKLFFLSFLTIII